MPLESDHTIAVNTTLIRPGTDGQRFPHTDAEVGAWVVPKALISVWGNSATWKTSTAHRLQHVLGLLAEDEEWQAGNATHIIEWDAYHRWERGDENWTTHTHLNPLANYLDKQREDLLDLRGGKPVNIRDYDHETGKFTEEKIVEPKDFLVFCGLHTLWPENMREGIFDMSIFMAHDEVLSRVWKISRDMGKRWYTRAQVEASIAKREEDKAAFIDPQAAFADVVVCYEPLIPIDIEDFFGEGAQSIDDVPLQLTLKIKNEIGVHEGHEIITLLRERAPELRILTDYTNGTYNRNHITVAGSVSSDQLAQVAGKLLPHAKERLPHFPLENGLNGVMQLFFLYIADKKKRANEL